MSVNRLALQGRTVHPTAHQVAVSCVNCTAARTEEGVSLGSTQKFRHRTPKSTHKFPFTWDLTRILHSSIVFSQPLVSEAPDSAAEERLDILS